MNKTKKKEKEVLTLTDTTLLLTSNSSSTAIMGAILKTLKNDKVAYTPKIAIQYQIFKAPVI